MSGTASQFNTPTACAALQAADLAYLALQNGGGVRAVTDQNGERIEYTMASAPSLLSVIRTLQTLCTTYQAISLGQQCRPGPMRFLF
jgi:hypothetical protein